MEKAKPPLTVDLTDPEDVRAKLPQARRIAKTLADEVQEKVDQANAWSRLVHVLEGVAGGVKEPRTDKALEEPTERGPSSEEIVREILEQTGGPMTTAEVRTLAPDTLKPDTISW